jgi:hypothetical protein
MSSEGTKTLIVKCPACQAVTKVVGIPEAKDRITCPKCKQPVALGPATLVREAGAAAAPASAAPHAGAYRSKYGRRRPIFWGGLIVGAGLSLIIVTIILTLLPPRPTGRTGAAPQITILTEMNRAYASAIAELEAVKNASAALRASLGQGAVVRRIQDLNVQLGALPPAGDADRDEVLRLESELFTHKRRYEEERLRVSRLAEGGAAEATQDRGAAATAPAVTVSAAPSSTDPVGADPAATTPAGGAEATAAASDPDKVTLSILNLEKEKATSEFLAGLQALAGPRSRILQRRWAGDLLVVEVGGVANLDRFAARLSFGQVTQLDKSQRTLTVLAKAGALGADGAILNLPVDPVDAALVQLQRAEVEKRLRAAQDLAQMRPEEPRPDVVEALTRALADKDLQCRLTAMKALARWGGAASAATLAGQLGDEAAPVRRVALDLLGELKNPAVAETIVRLNIVSDREAASAALQALGPPAEPAVLPLLNHETPEVRLEACRILRRIGTRTAIPELLKATQDARAPVADAAWDAIEAIAGRKG